MAESSPSSPGNMPATGSLAGFIDDRFAAIPPFAPKRRRSSAATRPTDDAETCRICRGEATPAESLFYPCKCSGSIKYVHQDCLMEWLSHSQKKYCELCKTPFRFTKLYHPETPTSLPTTLFLKKALSHISTWLLLWARAALVATVWLVFLPYTMRVVWRGLFWLADGGWARDQHVFNLMVRLNQSAAASSTAASPYASTASSNATLHLSLPQLLRPTSAIFNLTTGTPFLLSLFSRMLSLGVAPDTDSPNNHAAQVLMLRRLDSLLSDVSAIQHLTRWPTFNRAVIDVLEGLIISLSVVVAFVLVFLIREWVVQQQPLLNMHAEEHNQAEAVEGQVAQIIEPEEGPHEGAGGDAPREQVESPLGTPGDSTPEWNASESVPTYPTSAQQRAEATINRLPPEVQQAVRRGRLHEVVQNIKDLPPEEAARVKRLILEWAKTRNEQLDSAASDEAVSVQQSNGRETADSTRPPLTKGRAALAYKVKRDMEEDNGSDPHDAESSYQTQDAVSVSWDDSDTGLEHAARYTNKGKAKAKEQLQDHGPGSTQLDDLPPPETQFAADSQVTTPSTTSPGLAHADTGPTGPSLNQSIAHLEPNRSISSHASLDRQHITPASSQADAGGYGSVGPGPPTGAPSSLPSTLSAVLPPNTPLAATTGAASAPIAPVSFSDRMLDLIYGDLRVVEPAAADLIDDDEHVVHDLAEEDPFVPFAENQPAMGPGPGNPPANEAPEHHEAHQDPEVAAAAAAAGVAMDNPNMADDGEDLEGILELIGMQGPLTGLLQNALFSAVLISISISTVVWLPYCGGKLILLMIRTPIGAWFEVPFQVISAIENTLTDVALVIFAGLFYVSTAGFKFLYTVSMRMEPRALDALLRPSKAVAGAALGRLGNATIAASTAADVDGHEYLYASMAAHASLKGIEQDIKDALTFVLTSVSTSTTVSQTGLPIATLSSVSKGILHNSVALLKQVASIEFTLPSIFVLDAPDSVPASQTGVLPSASPVMLDPELAFWSARDRALTAGLSYLFLSVLGFMYLSLSPPLFSGGRVRKLEQLITDTFSQAGGVIKVILIISIEMITFPLFCGFLLDLALLPLFEDATVRSRVAFAVDRPWTSGFVHWFVGTCYMFHFALFVSMCRKIMRPGVLYFIRDPDDPTFHPVRDVLERSVATQLRKIAFSAIVYGALIVLCLGGVVWGLWAAFDGVLPLHWSSSNSALEFPLDILFYNFLTPLILARAKPSDGLHRMYKWWFRRCARFLRLSDFLFGKRLLDEEGYRAGESFVAGTLRLLEVPVDPSNTDELESDDKGGEALPKRSEFVDGEGFGPNFTATGRYVRAPATDQVRIPKDQPVFIPVTEDNKRLDGRPEDEGIHASDSSQTKFVYIPPWFALRISTFVVTIWLFAAATGCGITVVPLIAGRWMINVARSAIMNSPPNDATKINDIYAFSLGVYTLGGILYLALHLKVWLNRIQAQVQKLRHSVSPTTCIATLRTAIHHVVRVARVVYVFSFVLIVLPLAFSAVLELYILMPLHTLSAESEKTTTTQHPLTPHTVHLVQDWTLGLLYTRIAASLLMTAPDSLLYRALMEVKGDGGWWNPRPLRATRLFILPFSIIFGIIIAAPLAVATVANATVFAAETEAVKVLVSRLVYPLCSGALGAAYVGFLLAKATRRWRGRIKDELYLIGERLHNFGERKPPARGVAAS